MSIAATDSLVQAADDRQSHTPFVFEMVHDAEHIVRACLESFHIGGGDEDAEVVEADGLPVPPTAPPESTGACVLMGRGGVGK